jgi:hypothetical protein
VRTELENTLRGGTLDLADPPIDDPHCICPKYYPEFFA